MLYMNKKQWLNKWTNHSKAKTNLHCNIKRQQNFITAKCFCFKVLLFNLLNFCILHQDLLWIGSDPPFTVLFSDWFGSKVIAGEGAILNAISSSSKATPLRLRKLLRARSMFLDAETVSGWMDRNPTQNKTRTATLYVERHISAAEETKWDKVSTLVQEWWENGFFVWKWGISVCLNALFVLGMCCGIKA